MGPSELDSPHHSNTIFWLSNQCISVDQADTMFSSNSAIHEYAEFLSLRHQFSSLCSIFLRKEDSCVKIMVSNVPQVRNKKSRGSGTLLHSGDDVTKSNDENADICLNECIAQAGFESY